PCTCAAYPEDILTVVAGRTRRTGTTTLFASFNASAEHMLKINWHLRVLRCRPAEGDGGSSGGGVGPRLIHGQHMFSRCQEYVVLTFRLPVEGVVGTAGRCRYIVSICSGQIWDRLTSRWNREPQRPRKTASFRLSLISICST